MASELSSLKVLTQPSGSGVWAPATEDHHFISLGQLNSILDELGLESHAPVTKTDSNSVALTLTGQQISAAVRRKTSLGTNEGLISEDAGGLFVSLGTGSNQAARGSDLAGKANSSHSHSQDEVAGLAEALGGKAALDHTHSQDDIAGLSADLAGKAAADHTHSLATTSSPGFMSASMLISLNALIAGGGGGGGGNLYWKDPVATKNDLPLNTDLVGSVRLVRAESRLYASVANIGFINDQWKACTVGKISKIIGNGVLDVLDVAHNLATDSPVVALFETANGYAVNADWKVLDENTVRFTFGVAPPVSGIRATFVG